MGHVKLYGLLLVIILVFPLRTVAGSERVPFIYRTSAQECLVPVTAKFRDAGHKRYAFERIFTSFSELALEREKAAPLPTAGWGPALYDLFFLHIAGDCENRLKWAKILIDDYHGRFPDDAHLKVSPQRWVPREFFNSQFFRRIEPVYRVLDCRVAVRNTGEETSASYLYDLLSIARNDFYTLSGNRALSIRFAEGPREGELKLIFASQCEDRLGLSRSIFERAMEIEPGLKLKARLIPPTEDRTDQNRKSSFFTDTREGLQDYLPPRHNVK